MGTCCAKKPASSKNELLVLVRNVLSDLATSSIAIEKLESFVEVSTGESIEKIAANVSQWLSFGLVIGTQGFRAVYDLNTLYNSRMDGSLSRKEFTELATNKVTEAIRKAITVTPDGLLPAGGLFIGNIGAEVEKLTGSWIGGPLGKVVASLLDYDNRAVNSIDELHRGDHIVISRNGGLLGYHYIVIDHNAKKKKVDVIQSTRKHGVIKKCIDFNPPFYKVIYDDKDCHPPKVVCKRAKSKLGTNDYNLLTYNCKHFCFWCKKK